MKYVIVLFFACFFVPRERAVEAKKVNQDTVVLTKQNLVKVMKDVGVQHVDVVLAQAILESGEFKSYVFVTKNNMFGMKVPRKRETTAINKIKGYKGYAEYSSWIDCVKDYKLYQDYVTKNKLISKSDYLSILSRSYAETPEYVSKLKKIISQNKKYT